MAEYENREYVITIKNSTGSKSKNPIAGSDNGSSTEKGKGLLSREGAKTFGKTMVAYGTVKSFALQTINHEVSLVQLRTGSNELQGRANFTNSVVQKVVGIGESMFAGAMVGGLPGAIVGLTLSTAHTLIGYAQNQDRINTERSLENVSLQMNIMRAGANGSRGSK
jgi:hypothetical protein